MKTQCSNALLMPVPGHPGFCATSDGHIVGRSGRPVGWVRPDGYVTVARRVDGRNFAPYAHRMVAAAFHGLPTPDAPEVDHLNGNRSDNRPANLRWTDPKGNAATRVALGRHARGEASGRAKLTDDQVREIRSRAAAGETQTSLGREFGVVQTVISDVVTRKTWKHI